jgi:lipopolysaccharide export system permease protein
LRPEDFVDFQEQQAMMTTAELREYIRQQKARGVSNTPKYEIELYRRWTEPVTILILTLIGMAIASRKVRGGVGLHLAIGMGLGALYIFLSRFSIVFATGQVVPIVLGMWMPNIVFGAVAVWLVGKAQK